jgi:hypothetical protein
MLECSAELVLVILATAEQRNCRETLLYVRVFDEDTRHPCSDVF